jgi:protein translocase SecG subunit
MHVFQVIVMVIALLSGIALITSVALQTSKAQSFSAAMGGDSGRYRQGSKEEALNRITKVAAIIWISACVLNAVLYYRMHG